MNIARILPSIERRFDSFQGAFQNPDLSALTNGARRSIKMARCGPFMHVIFSCVIGPFSPLGARNLTFPPLTQLVIGLVFSIPPYREGSEMF